MRLARCLRTLRHPTSANNQRHGKEDIALGLLNMVFQTIGMLSVFALRNDTVKDVVLTGSLANMSIAPEVMGFVEEISDVKFFIPENATFATAIGAALPFVRNARI